MRLPADIARARLLAHDHGILSTVHAERGVDSVPVVYAVRDDLVGIPVDHVKPKTSTVLQRERNLRADPRATLLIEHWDPTDWSRLWWVRATLRWQADGSDEELRALGNLLEGQYAQYRGQPFARVLALRITGLTGWSGASG